MPQQHVFITGISGFIGFHLACKLYKLGIEVSGIDNFNDYYDVQLKKDRASLLISKGIEINHIDLCDFSELKQIMVATNPSHVVHLAAQPGVRRSLVDSQPYVESNLIGFVNILDVIKELKVPFIYASSSSIYGTNEKVPFAESDRTDTPSNLYGATKKANELIAYAYHHLYQIPMTGLRFFTVYGPWGRPDMAYFTFTKALFERRPLSLYDEGKLKRDFTYIDDIVQGIQSAIEHAYPFEIFNLGNHTPVSVKDFVSILEKEIGLPANIEFLPPQKGEMEMTFSDNNHSHEKLGFSPKTNLQEGLHQFVSWYREYYNT